MTKFLKRPKPFRKQCESNENDTHTSSLCRRSAVSPSHSVLQCAGVAALVEWLRGATAGDGQGFGPVRAAVLVVKSTIAIILLHGLVILLWASFYRLQCFPSWGTRLLLFFE
jgi:hypothetical protein